MVKKYLALLSIVSLTIFLGGCSIFGVDLPNISIPFFGGSGENESETTTQQEEVVLTYWSLFEPYEIYEPLITEYQELNPHVTINFEQRAYNDLDSYKDSLLVRMQSQERNPDIMRVHATWVRSFRGYLEPAPEDVLDANTVSSDFYHTVMETSVLNNQVYALPLMFDSLALIYNRDIFDDNNATPPDNWSDFYDLAVSLTDRSGDQIFISGAAIGSASNVAHFSDILGLLMNQSAIELPRDFNSQAFKDTLVFYTNFVDEGQVWNREQAYSPLAFAQGRTAMIIAPSWQLLSILEENPNLNVGVAPVPQIVAENTLTDDNFSTYWVEAVNSNSENAEEAWKFLEWLSKEEQLLKAYSTASERRAFGEPFPRVSMQDDIVSNTYLGPYFVHANNAETSVVSDLSGNSEYVSVFETLIEGILNGRDMDTLLQTAESEYRRLQERDAEL